MAFALGRVAPTATTAGDDADHVAAIERDVRVAPVAADRIAPVGDDLHNIGRSLGAAIHAPGKRLRATQAAIGDSVIAQDLVVANDAEPAAPPAGTDATFDVEGVLPDDDREARLDGFDGVVVGVA